MNLVWAVQFSIVREPSSSFSCVTLTGGRQSARVIRVGTLRRTALSLAAVFSIDLSKPTRTSICDYEALLPDPVRRGVVAGLRGLVSIGGNHGLPSYELADGAGR
jgi:hypothetical protein